MAVRWLHNTPAWPPIPGTGIARPWRQPPPFIMFERDRYRGLFVRDVRTYGLRVAKQLDGRTVNTNIFPANAVRDNLERRIRAINVNAL